MRTIAILVAGALAAGCGTKKTHGDSDADDGTEADTGLDVTEEEPEPALVDPIVPVAGSRGTEPVDCTGSYTLPAELTGADGLGHHGWDLDDLRFTLAWALPNRFENRWISRNDDTTPSLRVRPWLVPEAGACYESAVEATTTSDGFLTDLIGEITAFSHPETPYDGLEKDTYGGGTYELGGDDALVAAIRGLVELPNELPDAPVVEPWSIEEQQAVQEAVAGWPAAMREAVARLVLAVGEAYELKQDAIGEADEIALARIHQQFLDEYYATLQTTFVSPVGTTVVDDIRTNATWIDYRAFNAAGIAVTSAVEGLWQALEGVEPFASPGLDVLTPHGRIVVRTADEDTTYSAEELADAAVVIDLGGSDSYAGRYAATHRFWMSASVLVDMRGDDLYSPETADIESPSTRNWDAFDNATAFTQGTGLFGVGVLLDGAGTDRYTASSYAQGSAAFGVGVLYDLTGADDYRLGNAGQGQGYFGIGACVDGGGDDRYGIYTTGQGAGRPYGHGLLLDLSGNDTYIGYYQALDPDLPSPGYNNYYSLTGDWAYSDGAGNPHYMSNCQGIGWGFRGDWTGLSSNWMGGFGALVDLGSGNDVHYADCMSMGQGYVYGFGFLYDGGGDDVYRTFWWGPAASAHMGVSLFVEKGGDDDIHVSRLSGGYGYDCSVGWLLDYAGDDTYAGRFNYGKGYTYGMTFFVDYSGVDSYNADDELADPPFGIVHDGAVYQNLIGAFLDLGGDADDYHTSLAGVGNDAAWYLNPIGTNVDPAHHKGIGIDR